MRSPRTSSTTASFLIGAGGHDDTYVALCTVDGTEVLQARGKNGELMRRITWDVKDLVGKKVFVKIVDMHTTGWGHVTFDDFQAVGRIDPAATAARRADRAKIEKARLAQAQEEARAMTAKLADEVMSGFEYSAAATMVQAGLLREGFAIVRAAYDRYDGRLRTNLAGSLREGRQSWGYSGNPFGDDECGKFYARPMSIWSMLTASQGFVYDGPAGVIGFLPLWKPEDHRSFFTAAEGWGVFSQSRKGKE